MEGAFLVAPDSHPNFELQSEGGPFFGWMLLWAVRSADSCPQPSSGLQLSAAFNHRAAKAGKTEDTRLLRTLLTQLKKGPVLVGANVCLCPWGLDVSGIYILARRPLRLSRRQLPFQAHAAAQRGSDGFELGCSGACMTG